MPPPKLINTYDDSLFERKQSSANGKFFVVALPPAITYPGRDGGTTMPSFPFSPGDATSRAGPAFADAFKDEPFPPPQIVRSAENPHGEIYRPMIPPPRPRAQTPGTRTPADRPQFTPSEVNGCPCPMASEYVPAWKVVLEAAKMPTIVVTIDFETYFDETYGMGRSATALSTIEYVMDERFEILGCGFLTMRGDAPFVDHRDATRFVHTEKEVRSYIKYLQTEFGNSLERCTVLMQNAPFDATILARHFGIYPKFAIDLIGLSRHRNAKQKHDLNTLCAQLELEEKGDTEQFSGWTYRDRVVMVTKGRGANKTTYPEKRPILNEEMSQKLSDYGGNDVMREWEGFTILLPQLSNQVAAVELAIMRHTLEIFTRPVLKVNEKKAMELIDAMVKEMEEAVALTGLTPEQLSGNISFEEAMSSALVQCGDDPRKYMKEMKKGDALAIAKGDPQRAILASHPSEEVRNLLEGRNAVKSWPLHIKRVQRILAQAKAADGFLPVALKYYGAHTGRFSGAELINLQNLGGKKSHELVQMIKAIIEPAEGEVLVIADAAAIEARGLAWVAGEHSLVMKFAANEEIYCGFASTVLGMPIRKPVKSDPPPVAKRLKWARDNIGKIGILGCGYKMGPIDYEEFRATGKEKPNTLFALAGLDTSMAKKIVNTYRAMHPNIVKFWDDVEKAFIYTIKYGDSQIALPIGSQEGKTPEDCYLVFAKTADADVSIKLPSGRELRYVHARMGNDEKNREQPQVFEAMTKSWHGIYGGLLTENIVQGMCRDILTDAIPRCEDRSLHICMHCHDELVGNAKKAESEAKLKIMIEELSRTPAWAPGLPLGAEGCVANY